MEPMRRKPVKIRGTLKLIGQKLAHLIEGDDQIRRKKGRGRGIKNEIEIEIEVGIERAEIGIEKETRRGRGRGKKTGKLNKWKEKGREIVHDAKEIGR